MKNRDIIIIVITIYLAILISMVRSNPEQSMEIIVSQMFIFGLLFNNFYQILGFDLDYLFSEKRKIKCKIRKIKQSNRSHGWKNHMLKTWNIKKRKNEGRIKVLVGN